ncbi:hypothetical protein V5O48_002216 [Marasmius crinis-equi]|uniref:SAGA-associated factor 11 n=1 Tax=Marasmius crinis-equi TaxID=585013 RepID=A0ABR3FWC0_9AGAR
MPTKAEKQERENFISGLTTKIFCAMLEDIAMDAAIQAHNEVSRSRAICEICGTRCNAVHVPGPSKTQATSSRAVTPMLEGKPANGTTSTSGTGTPSKDGNVYLDCVNCNRPFASNRYAAHLSSCLGLSSARRGPNRSTNAKSKSSDAGRSDSPASEMGNVSDDNESKSSVKGKAKSKGKRADEAEFNLKRKRPVSPQVSPSKKPKAKALTPSSFGRSSPGVVPASSSLGSQTKIPSKLRDSSTAPYPASTSASSSRSSSPDAKPLAAKFTGPNFKTKGNGQIRNRSPNIKRPSPPRPPPPVQAYMHGELRTLEGILKIAECVCDQLRTQETKLGLPRIRTAAKLFRPRGKPQPVGSYSSTSMRVLLGWSVEGNVVKTEIRCPVLPVSPDGSACGHATRFLFLNSQLRSSVKSSATSSLQAYKRMTSRLEDAPFYTGVIAVALSLGYLAGSKYGPSSQTKNESKPESIKREKPQLAHDESDSESESESIGGDGDLAAVELTQEDECKLVLVVRSDLGMSTGKIAAQ